MCLAPENLSRLPWKLIFWSFFISSWHKSLFNSKVVWVVKLFSFDGSENCGLLLIEMYGSFKFFWSRSVRCALRVLGGNSNTQRGIPIMRSLSRRSCLCQPPRDRHVWSRRIGKSDRRETARKRSLE